MTLSDMHRLADEMNEQEDVGALVESFRQKWAALPPCAECAARDRQDAVNRAAFERWHGQDNSRSAAARQETR